VATGDGPTQPKIARLIQGRGRYVGDLKPPAALHVGFVRSLFPAAEVVSIDTKAALALPGVRAVLTGHEVNTRLRPLRIEGPGLQAHDWFPMAGERAYYEGEAVAVVVAADPYMLADAIQAVQVEWRETRPLVGIEESLAAGAPPLRPDLSDNVLFEREIVTGDPAGAFANAAIVIERTFRNGRMTPLPLEPRGVVAQRDPWSRRIALWISTQSPNIARTAIAQALGAAESQIRVVTPDVGGGFGAKAQVFAEEIVLGLLANDFAEALQWIETRMEHLLSCSHAHDQRMRIRLGATSEGKIVALEAETDVDNGAHSAYPLSASLEPVATGLSVLACYRIPAARARTRAIATNKSPVGAYRGVGVPFSAFCSERMLDELAERVGCDRVEIRRRNLINGSEMPYQAWAGATYDSGDYQEALNTVLELADWEGLVERRRQAAAGGREVLGLGLAVFNEHSGPGSRAYRKRGVTTIPGFDSARVTMEPNGTVMVYVSSADAGQSHEEMYRLIVARELGVPIDRVRVVEGDTDLCPPGTGTYASRGGTAHAAAVVSAARALRGRLHNLAAAALNQPVEDLVAAEGGFGLRDGSAGIGFDTIAQMGHLRTVDSPGALDGRPVLDETAFWDPEPTYPYGAQVAVVAIDRQTFHVRVLDVFAVEDCGFVIDKESVDRQIVGAISMGIGNALFEEVLYSPDGHLLSTSLLDYLVPMITDTPRITLEHLVTLTDRTPLGSKGVAEAGTIGAVAAVGTAVADALRELGGEVSELPASPMRLFSTLDGAEGGLWKA
jgi:aerobic carbon-monoxide dehydrogenase large subunit